MPKPEGEKPSSVSINHHHQQKWEERFLTTLSIPIGDIYRWVETAVVEGLIGNSGKAKRLFAKEMGAIMSFVLPEIDDDQWGQVLNGSKRWERFAEELDTEEIANQMGMHPKRVRNVITFMTEVGAIRSQEKWTKQRKENRYNTDLPPLI